MAATVTAVFEGLELGRYVPEVIDKHGVEDVETLAMLKTEELLEMGLGAGEAERVSAASGVAAFLHELSLEQHARPLIASGVTSIPELRKLSEQQLTERGVHKIGHRKRIRQRLGSTAPGSTTAAATSLGTETTNHLRTQMQAVYEAANSGDGIFLPAKVLLRTRHRSPAWAPQPESKQQPLQQQQKPPSIRPAAKPITSRVPRPHPLNAPSLRPPLRPPEHQAERVYCIGECIGQGSFGCVYRATGAQTGRVYAVKVITIREKNLAEKARLEYEILKTLDNPNIVKVEDFYMEDDESGAKTFNIVMPLINAGDLNTVMSDCGSSVPALQNFTFQILSGLQYLHDKKIIHSDIKPQNILVDTSNRLKLTDFGLSRFAGRGKEELVEQGGTLIYKSPRLVHTKGNHTYQSDIWAFGCTVLELATSHQPWHNKKFMNQAQITIHIGNCWDSGEIPSLAHEQIEEHDELKNFLKFVFQCERQELTTADVFKHPFLSLDHPGLNQLHAALRPVV